MFLGHVGIGLGIKSLSPRISLGTLLAASLFIDLLRPVIALMRLYLARLSGNYLEISSPEVADFSYTHSLLGVLFWASLFAVTFYIIRRTPREALICGIVVISNWVLDLVTLHSDLTLAPGLAIQAGINLFAYLPAVLATELSIFIIGIGFYCYRTKASDQTGIKWFWGMMILLLAVSLITLFGPDPGSPLASAWLGQALWLLVFWGYWIERHRKLRWLYN